DWSSATPAGWRTMHAPRHTTGSTSTTSGRPIMRTRLNPTAWLLVLLAATGSLHAAAPEQAPAGDAVSSEWILDRLARPAPMRTRLVELREARPPRLPLPLRA